MPIKKSEQSARDFVDGVHQNVTPKSTVDKRTIRAQAITEFTRYLDGKLANLQEGETLLFTYRIDIRSEDGTIRGGSGSERNMPEYITWRKAVFERDSYTCQECGAKGDIQAHHIKHWSQHPSERFNIDNGITLCAECHKKKHPHLRFTGHHGNTRQKKQNP